MKGILVSIFIVMLLASVCAAETSADVAVQADWGDFRAVEAEGHVLYAECGVGGEVELRLISNPTTGFEWILGALPKCVAMVSETYTELRGKDDVVGAPSVHSMRFRAADKGMWFFPLVYARSWENNAPNKYTLVCITVK